ncbi:MAG: hypothetical protein ACRD44_16220, partial [Bryobacteraceae bacterium]
MTTSPPLELPLKASEAAALSALVFEHVEEAELTAEVRGRLAGIARSMSFSSVRPYFGSLQH